MADPILEARALAFATGAHAAVRQKRKYTSEDYIVHPIAVAKLVAEYNGTPEMIAAAYLHDVVEDTHVTIDHVCDMFGPVVGMYVSYLTDVSKPEDGNRETRKAIDRAHTADAPFEAQFIKCADLIHNTESITAHDKNFARVYMKEKALLLNEMGKVRDTPIFKRAAKLVEDYYKNS